MSWLDTFAEIRSRDWSQEPESARESTAREVVTISAYAGAAAAVVPVPLVDLALLLPFHSAMVMTIGHVYGRPVTKAEAKRVALELGAVAGVTFAGRAALTALKKLLLPGLGGMLAAPASFAITWGFGQLVIAYFKDPGLSQEELKKVFRRGIDDAAQVFSAEAFERWREQMKSSGGAAPEESADAADAKPAAEPSTAEPASSRQGDEPRDPLRPRKRSL
jgi:uncharacterized protein (DUF697 family)